MVVLGGGSSFPQPFFAHLVFKPLRASLPKLCIVRVMSSSSWDLVDDTREPQHTDGGESSSSYMLIEEHRELILEVFQEHYEDQKELIASERAPRDGSEDMVLVGRCEVLEKILKKKVDEMDLEKTSPQVAKKVLEQSLKEIEMKPDIMKKIQEKIEERTKAIATNTLTPLQAKCFETNLKEVESKPHIWKLDRESGQALCKTCDTWYNLLGDPVDIVNHEYHGRHQRIIKKIADEEREKHLENLRKESIEDKKAEIIGCLEDHPMFLRWQWLPLGHFLKIFKVDLQNRGEISREFLVASETDHHEVIFEALNWLDE